MEGHKLADKFFSGKKIIARRCSCGYCHPIINNTVVYTTKLTLKEVKNIKLRKISNLVYLNYVEQPPS